MVRCKSHEFQLSTNQSRLVHSNLLRFHDKISCGRSPSNHAPKIFPHFTAWVNPGLFLLNAGHRIVPNPGGLNNGLLPLYFHNKLQYLLIEIVLYVPTTQKSESWDHLHTCMLGNLGDSGPV